MCGMAEQKKRLPPWPLITCAVLAVLLATVIGPVGRYGTLIGRRERLKEGMSLEEVQSALGTAPDDYGQGHREGEESIQVLQWSEGPVHVTTDFLDEDSYFHPATVHLWKLKSSHVSIDSNASLLWRFRRWAEQAYMACHGQRR
jgi:hypothetical protein